MRIIILSERNVQSCCVIGTYILMHDNTAVLYKKNVPLTINIFLHKVACIRNIRHGAHRKEEITAQKSIADKRCLDFVFLLMEQNARFMTFSEQRLRLVSDRMGDNIFQSCFVFYDRQRAATQRDDGDVREIR